MTFFQSYYEYAKTLNAKTRLAFYDAILGYFFAGVEPEPSSVAYSAFMLVKPTLDASKRRSEAGRMGGSKLGESKARPANKNASKTQALLANENASKTQGIIRSKDKEKERESECYAAEHTPAPPPAPLSSVPVRRPDVPDEATVIGVATSAMGVTEDFARWWFAEMTARDWTGTDGRRVDLRNWRPTLKAWYNRRRPDEVRDAEQVATVARLAARKFKPEDWMLCAERCANFKDGACSRGVKTPPDKEQYPKPPEECKNFRA